MANEIRLKETESEKLINSVLGASEHVNFNMRENSIESLVEKENARKFNSELEKYSEQMESRNKEVQEAQESLGYNISDDNVSIKPMLSRILVKPFKQNPFQKMDVRNGIIVDAGGYTPHTQKNPMTGKYEEQDQFIITGCVVEIGPEVKYLKEGDVIYFRKDTTVPVPFLKQGLISLAENQVIAAVNVGLDERFEKAKNEQV